MSALGLPLAVLALGMGTSWIVAAALHPLAGALIARWPSIGRYALAIAALPVLAGLAVAVAAVLPGDPHLGHGFGCHCAHSMPGWLHLCPAHPERAVALLPFAALVLLMLLPGRVRAWRDLLREPLGSGGGAEPVLLDLPRPTALLVGWLRPSLVVDPRLWDALALPEREALLAHERAHLVRRDPLVLAALLALVSFGPAAGGRALVRAWLDRAELCADALATREVDPLALASALMRGARLGAHTNSLAPSLTGGSLERRVERLLVASSAPNASSGDVRAVDTLGLVGFAGLTAACLPWLHHQVEHLLNLSW